LGDSNNQLVQASLHALADAVPVVGGDVIVGSGRRKIFSLAMPKVGFWTSELLRVVEKQAVVIIPATLLVSFVHSEVSK